VVPARKSTSTRAELAPGTGVAAATAPAVRSQLPDFAGLIHPLPSPTPSTADDFALSKAISRQDRGGDDFGFAVERHFATARRDADSAALKQFAGRVN